VNVKRHATAAAVAAVLLAPAGARAGFAQEAAITGEAVTLAQALDLALQNSAAILTAQAQAQRSEKDLAASRTRRLPSFELQASATQLLTSPSIAFPAGAFGTFPGTGPIPATDTVIKADTAPTGWMSASIAQPLTQLYKAGLGVKANRLTRDSDRQELRAQRAAVAHEVRRLYYAALQAQGAKEAARDQAKALRQMNDEVGRYVALEAALPAEGLDVKAHLAAQEYRIVALDNSLEAYKQQLNTLFGRDPFTPFDLVAVTAASVEEVDVQAARARALERRPELAQSELRVEQAETARRIKKAELIPEVSLAVTYNSFFNVELLPRSIAQVGLQLKWEPFDWGRRGKELASKTLAVDQARFAARDERHRVLMEVDRAFRQVQEARALVQARRMAHETAQERARVAVLRASAQSVLLRDVLQAQADMAASRADYDEAQFSLWQARAELDKAMGEDR
jgi:outer membrane protein TolC